MRTTTDAKASVVFLIGWINGNAFEKGTMFKSVRKCVIVMGFETHSAVQYQLEVKDGCIGGWQNWIL